MEFALNDEDREVLRISGLCKRIVAELFYLVDRVNNFHSPLGLPEAEIELDETSFSATGIKKTLQPIVSNLILARGIANQVGKQQSEGLEATIRGFSEITRRCAEVNMDQDTITKVLRVTEVMCEKGTTRDPFFCEPGNVRQILLGKEVPDSPADPPPVTRIDMDELLWQSSDDESCDSKCDTGDELMETPKQRRERIARKRQRHARRKNKRELKRRPRKMSQFPTFTNTNIVFFILRRLGVKTREQVTRVSFSKFVRRIIKIARNDAVFSRIIAPRNDKQLYWSFQQPLQQLVEGYESYRPHANPDLLFSKLHSLYLEKLQAEKSFATQPPPPPIIEDAPTSKRKRL